MGIALEGVEVAGIVVALWIIALLLALTIVVRALFNPLTSIGWGIGSAIGGLLDSMESGLRSALNATMNGLVRVLSEFLDDIAVVVGLPLAVGVFAWDSLAGHIQHLVTRKIPALIHAAVDNVRDAVNALTHRTTIVEQKVVHEVSRAGTIEQGLQRSLTNEAIRPLRHFLDTTWSNFQTRYNSLVHFTTVTLPTRVADLGGRVGTLEREMIQGVRVRLGRLEALTTEAAIGAVAIAAISRLIPWIRCNNVGRVGRGLCGMDESMLEALLGGALTALVFTDLEEIIRLAQATAEGVKGELEEMIGL